MPTRRATSLIRSTGSVSRVSDAGDKFFFLTLWRHPLSLQIIVRFTGHKQPRRAVQIQNFEDKVRV